MARRGLRPVNSLKHVFDTSILIASGVNTAIEIMDAVTTPNLTSPKEVMIGSTVNAIYLNVEIAATEDVVGGIPNVYLAVFKNPGNNIANPDPSLIGVSDSKRFVIHQEMRMLQNKAGGNPRSLFNGVIRIPRGYRRNGNDDTLELLIKSPIVNITACVQCIFKEYR